LKVAIKKIDKKTSQEILTVKEYEIAVEFKDVITNTVQKFNTKAEYDAICFSGGGAKGICFAGILEILGEDRLKKIKTVSGASAGAIAATLVAVGIKPYEFTEFIATNDLRMTQSKLKKLIEEKIFNIIKKRLIEFKNQEETPELTDQQKQIMLSFNIQIDNKMINSNQIKSVTFEDLEELIKNFPDVGFKSLFIAGHNREQCIEEKLSIHKKMPISLAVLASAALPVLFKPVNIKEYTLNNKNIIINDGGIINNTPFNYLLANNAENSLILCFKDHMCLWQKKITLSEQIRHLFAKNAFLHRRIDSKILFDYSNQLNPLYLDNQDVETISFKKAARKFFNLTQKIKEAFIEYEFNNLNENNNKLEEADRQILLDYFNSKENLNKQYQTLLQQSKNGFRNFVKPI
jgi:predicted acylesterase/phospholipase RssA